MRTPPLTRRIQKLNGRFFFFFFPSAKLRKLNSQLELARLELEGANMATVDHRNLQPLAQSPESAADVRTRVLQAEINSLREQIKSEEAPELKAALTARLAALLRASGSQL
jgi:hypothetical protein